MALQRNQTKDCIKAGPQRFSNVLRGSKGLLGAFCEGAFRDRKIDKARIKQLMRLIIYEALQGSLDSSMHLRMRLLRGGGHCAFFAQVLPWESARRVQGHLEFLVLDMHMNSCDCKHNPEIKAQLVFIGS